MPVDPRALRYGRMGMAIVSAAGPFSNLILAFVSAVVFRQVVLPSSELASWAPDWLPSFLIKLLAINIGLCVFNLIPLPPLDGFGIAVGVLPWAIARPLARLAQYGPGLLMLLVMAPSLLRIDILGIILNPVRTFLLRLIIATTGLPLN